MLKNTEGREGDAFEQEMEYRIANLKNSVASEKPYLEGMAAGYRYALAVYRECRRDGTI